MGVIARTRHGAATKVEHRSDQRLPIVGGHDALRTLTRAAALLRLVAEAPEAPVTLTVLAQRSGLHKATAHRLLAGLVAEGLVDQVDKGYLLGPQLWLLGQAAAPQFDLADIAAPSLSRIAEHGGDVALLSMLVRPDVRCIGRVEGGYPILPSTLKVGVTRPLGCGAHALALLAALRDEEIEAVLQAADRRSSFSRFTDAYLRDKVAETRRNGFALSDEDVVPGMTAVGIAVHDGWRRPLASLSYAAISPRLGPDRREGVVAVLRREVALIEMKLQGGRRTP